MFLSVFRSILDYFTPESVPKTISKKYRKMIRIPKFSELSSGGLLVQDCHGSSYYGSRDFCQFWSRDWRVVGPKKSNTKERFCPALQFERWVVFKNILESILDNRIPKVIPFRVSKEFG